MTIRQILTIAGIFALACILALVDACAGRDVPLVGPIVFSPTARVQWAANREPDLAGYRVTAVTDSGRFVFITQDTTIDIPAGQLIKGQVGRVVVWAQAYDRDGNVSTPSASDSLQVSRRTWLWGDANGDSTVNAIDIAMFWYCHGARIGETRYNAVFDFDMNGHIFVIDHVALIVNHGKKL